MPTAAALADKENKHHAGCLRSMKKQDSDSALLKQAKSLTEDDLEQELAPESLLEEERRLRQEREQEEQAAAQAASHNEAADEGGSDSAAADDERTTVLERSKFAKLDALLNKAGMYTQFLHEQMASSVADKESDKAAAEQQQEPAAEPEAGSKKRKGGRAPAAAKKGSKKAKQQQQQQVAAEEEVEPALAEAKKLAQATANELFPDFEGDLRDYQLKGVKWLISLYQNGVSGILADEMGLGKTVQTIAFLAHLRSKNVFGPHLVVGPLSTLPNWVNEFKRWAPGIPVCLYHGSKQERQALRQTVLKFQPGKGVDRTFPVICTSYEIVISDRKFLERFPKFKYIVVDEGHRLKNFNCKLIRELKMLPSDCRLLLTGTPLQNNLSELWSLLNFVLPDVFDSLTSFESWFDFEGMVADRQEGGGRKLAALEQRNQVVSKLHGILKPFLLRRVKSDVAKSLPGKMEVILYAHMTPLQQRINDQLRDKTLADMGEVLEKVGRDGGSSGACIAPGQLSKLNNVLMQMRKNCNHPDLITGGEDGSIEYPSPEEIVEQCGKLQLLDRLLTRLRAGGHKVLIFSQMTKMLDLLESYLTQQAHTVCRLDGGTSWQERQANIDAFNGDGAAWVFLLSTRAGGLGINLVAADTVIIYDSDWNPHQDLQAMDRAHRLGQTRPVLVFRLATAHSVEGRMLKRAADKLALERLVIKKGAFMDVAEDEGGAGAAEPKRGFQADELVAVLKGDISLDDEAQSGVVDDAMLGRLLDRTHIMRGEDAPYPRKAAGYEIVAQQRGASLLTTLVTK